MPVGGEQRSVSWLAQSGSKLIAKNRAMDSDVVLMGRDEKWAYSRWRKLSSVVSREACTQKSGGFASTAADGLA
jgi:hypothetical protein